MNTSTHKVTYSNTRSRKSQRVYENLTEAEMAQIIQEQHALDNGVRVYAVYHADGSRCAAWDKVAA
jgi:hypothetical protein